MNCAISLVPINRKYPIEDLLAICKTYAKNLGEKRTVTVEYTLIDGVNERYEHAEQLSRLLRGFSCKINLIPFNPFPGTDYRRPSMTAVRKFQEQTGHRRLFRGPSEPPVVKILLLPAGNWLVWWLTKPAARKNIAVLRQEKLHDRVGRCLLRLCSFSCCCQGVLRSLRRILITASAMHHPSRVQRQIDLGIGYLRQGDYQRAKEKLNRALEIDPKNGTVHATFGLLFQLEGEYELAERYFRDAVRYDPNSAQARNSFGAFLFARERYSEAVEQLKLAAENRFYQNRPIVFENLGVAYLRLNDIENGRICVYPGNPAEPGTGAGPTGACRNQV